VAEKKKAVKKAAGSKKATSAKKAAPKKAAGAKKAGAKKAASTSSPRVTAGGGMSGEGGTPAHADIAERAYYISEREGGTPEDNWLRAERELREKK
jgi:hypothetical protein